MPITLTSAFNPGDAAADGPYPKLTLTSILHQPLIKRIVLHLSYGDDGTGVHVPGDADPGLDVVIEGADYDTVMASVALSGSESLEDHGGRVYYQYVIDSTSVSGTIS